MLQQQVTCPECKGVISMTRNETVYGHAVSCFHLPGQGPKRDLDSIITTKSRSAEHIRRASTLLKIALEQEK